MFKENNAIVDLLPLLKSYSISELHEALVLIEEKQETLSRLLGIQIKKTSVVQNNVSDSCLSESELHDFFSDKKMFPTKSYLVQFGNMITCQVNTKLKRNEIIMQLISHSQSYPEHEFIHIVNTYYNRSEFQPQELMNEDESHDEPISLSHFLKVLGS